MNASSWCRPTTARLAQLSLDDLPRATLSIRGRTQAIEVGLVKSVDALQLHRGAPPQHARPPGAPRRADDARDRAELKLTKTSGQGLWAESAPHRACRRGGRHLVYFSRFAIWLWRRCGHGNPLDEISPRHTQPMDATSPIVSRPRGRTRLNVPALINRLRLASGLVMFSYISGHLLTHALGVVSLDAMLAAQIVFNTVWRFLPFTVLLFGAAVIHISLALWSIYRRRQLRMPPWEAAQLLFGLAIPPVLVDHVIGIQIAQEAYGINADYVYMLYAFGKRPGARHAAGHAGGDRLDPRLHRPQLLAAP